ncbi:rhodopsin [Acropora cervicornis]|uniref:Rhodopsin n=1 Tax=Acropora cervicornis TaxID=6130 RepID=A0AAD9VGA8_ACRCE|nr:rhodopsin [Acropora cervicornis]
MQTLPALAKLFCSEEFTQGLDKQIICFSVINAVLPITALVGNTVTVVLIALHKETSLHRPSKTLLQNLVASDLCVGFAQLTLVSNCVSILRKQWRICQFFFHAHLMIGVISISVSLSTLVAISVDRLLALLLGLRYRQVVTVRRVYVVVIVLWILIVVGMAILTMLNTDAGVVVAQSCIPKDSVHLTMAADVGSVLFFAVFAAGSPCISTICKNTVTKFLYPVLFHGDFNVFEFNPKPNFILLEDQKGKKSSEGDIALSSNVKQFSCLLVRSATAVLSTLTEYNNKEIKQYVP